jgi:hypothetical protein
VLSRGSRTMIARPAASSGYTARGTPQTCGNCAAAMRIASALTNPTMALRGRNRISFATPSRPNTTCRIPARITAATRYGSPWSRTSGATTRATAPVAAEIIAGRPPTTAVVTAMVNVAKRPTRGSTPAMIEKAMASGVRASATTRPESTSVRRTAVPQQGRPGDGTGGSGHDRPSRVGAGQRSATVRRLRRECGGARGAQWVT